MFERLSSNYDICLDIIDDLSCEKTIRWNVEVVAQPRDSHPVNVGSRPANDALRPPRKAFDEFLWLLSVQEWTNETANPTRNFWNTEKTIDRNCADNIIKKK